MDPYAPPGSESNAAPSDLESSARTSAILGVVSMALCMLMICTCYLSLPVGGILGVVAFVMARGVKANEPSGEALAYSNVGFAAGLVSAIYAAILLLGIGAYIVLYMALVATMIVAEGF